MSDCKHISIFNLNYCVELKYYLFIYNYETG